MTMTALSELLRSQPVFGELDAESIAEIAGCARNVHFPEGEQILTEGDPADQFFLIRRGRVALSTHAPHRGPVLIETLGPGDVLGWSWLMPPYRWHFDAMAIESTSAMMFDGACLRARFDREPRLGYELMQAFLKVIVSRLQATRLRLLDVYGR